MANSKRRCTHCKKYKPAEKMLIKPAGAFCDIDCLMGYAKNKANHDRLVRVGRKEVEKLHREKKRKFKANDKSLRVKEADKAFNKFIRLRDADRPCISCQRFHTGQYHAGHFMPKGVNSALRYDENNVHKQCAPCNNNLSGNLTLYRIHLIEKIGEEAVIKLENNKEIHRFTCEELKAIELHYKQKCKELESLAA